MSQTTLRAAPGALRYLPGMRVPALICSIAIAIAPGVAVANDSDEVETRPWLGIAYTANGAVAGLLVTNVFEESAAMAAGLRTGDEIVEVDGISTADSKDLTGLIQPRQIGDVVTLRVWRDQNFLTLRPELTRRLTEAELLHVELVGKLAPAFSLIRPDDPEGDVIDDSILRGKVGIVVWAHLGCGGCPGLANKIAPWVDRHRGSVGVVGFGTRVDSPIEQQIASAQAVAKASPILLPVGLDSEAWTNYSPLDYPSLSEKAVVVVVDRAGVVQMATAIATTADDSALDDVFAAAERALKPRKSRRSQ
jgi:membrane-associated protease RseP (regulator of RpoE activity)